MNSAIK